MRSGVKIRDADSRMVKNKAVYVALGVSRDGLREVLGLWVADNEGAKFWLSVMTELKYRTACSAFLISRRRIAQSSRCFPDAFHSPPFPMPRSEPVSSTMVRHSLNVCAWKDRKAVASSHPRPGLPS